MSPVSPHTTDQKILKGLLVSMKYRTKSVSGYFFPDLCAAIIKFNMKVCQDKLKG